MKQKFKAFLTHLLISIFLITTITGLIIYFWYPIEYLGITNFKEIAILIVSVDLILGPLLTLIVFNPKKKSLKFDLGVIVAIQVFALGYGIYALYEAHPLFITYNHKSFNLIQANEVKPSNAKYNEFKVSKLASPKLAYAKMPNDPKKQMEIIVGIDVDGNPDIDKRTEYYEPYEKHLDTILNDSIDAVKLFDINNLTPSSKAFLKEHGSNKDTYAYLPLNGISGDAIIVIDKKTAKVVSTIKVDPWKFAKK